MAVKPVPEGYHTITPYLVVPDAGKLIDFLTRAFGAQEVMRMPDPSGRIMHAEVRVGDSMLMCADATERYPAMTGLYHLYVPDADAAYKAALAAGAQSNREPTNEFYGDRVAQVRDPSGCIWYMATHVEDVSGEEIERRFNAMFKEKQSGAA